ncbi:hypothetical protein E2C01_049175 [Portunus trituberculatus]|uniref:Uncharacterized protein n=1 Tax=Portunus trituberculatus TaxID=210409 RepID=A0A5B7G8I2_PORTR|nr:hypothetical protein [Portunus trituberculatus]
MGGRGSIGRVAPLPCTAGPSLSVTHFSPPTRWHTSAGRRGKARLLGSSSAAHGREGTAARVKDSCSGKHATVIYDSGEISLSTDGQISTTGHGDAGLSGTLTWWCIVSWGRADSGEVLSLQGEILMKETSLQASLPSPQHRDKRSPAAMGSAEALAKGGRGAHVRDGGVCCHISRLPSISLPVTEGVLPGMPSLTSAPPSSRQDRVAGGEAAALPVSEWQRSMVSETRFGETTERGTGHTPCTSRAACGVPRQTV